jgi:hypothetical protein
MVMAAALAACTSAHADDPGYELRLTPETTIALDTTAAISVALVPSAGRTVSAAGPVRVAIEAPDAIGVPRRRFARKDAADPAADAPRFDVKLKARAAGDHTVTVDVRFWLCGRRVCRPIATTRTMVVHVPAPMLVDAAVPVDAGVDAVPTDAGRRRR